MRARRLSPPQNCRVNPKTRKLLLAEANADATRAAYHAWERIQAERPLKREERTAMVAARGEMHKADKALVAARKRPIAPTTPDAYPGWTWKNHPGLVSGYFESESHSRIVPKEDLHARHFSAYTVWSPDGRDLGTRKSAALAVELADRHEALGASRARANPKAPRSPTGSKRKGLQKAKRGYQVQAFLLDADSFDLTRARAWLKMWGHKADNIRLRGPVYRAEQYPSEDFYETTLHTVGMAKHVDAVIGKPQPETDAAGAPADRRAARQQVLFPRKRSSEPKYVPDPEFGF